MSEQIKPARDKLGQWAKGTSGNPSGVPRSARLVREMLEPHLKDVIARTLAAALTGDVQAIRLILERACPPLKSDEQPQEIPGLAEATTFEGRVKVIIEAMGRGELSTERAATALSALRSAAELTDLAELKKLVETFLAKDVL